jgi:hypothetical protein
MYRECRHIKDDGLRCRTGALKGKPYCFFHMKLKRMDRQPMIQIPMLEDSTSVLLAIGQVMRMLALETMDTKRAGLMLYGLQIASTVIQQREQAKPEEYVRSVHDEAGNDIDFSEALIRETPALAPETTVCEPPHDCAHCEQKSTCTRASQPTQGASGPAFETWETIDSRPLPRTLKKIAAAASIHPQHRPVLGTQNKLNPRLRVKRARLQPAHTPRKRLSRRFVTTARLQPGHTPCQPKTRALAPVPPALSNLPAIASDRALPENLKPRRAPETRAG